MASIETKPRVLVAAEWFPPAYRAGGPIRSVSNLVEALGSTHEVWVVAGAYDLAAEHPMDELTVNVWLPREWGHVMYVTRDRWHSLFWRELMAEIGPRYLYLNSLFARFFALRALQAARAVPSTQVVLAPRGMLGAGALQIKPLKKAIFLALARWLRWFEGVRWHATTDMERNEILRVFPQAEVSVASNIPSMAHGSGTADRLNDRVWKVAVLGRIHPKKNIEFGLRALAKVVAEVGLEVEVSLIGEAENSAYLARLMHHAVAGLRIHHLGAVKLDEVGTHLSASHFLLLPTLHENYGHAIVEAWAHGCPVFLSDQTPWRALESKQLGWDWPLDYEAWSEGLRFALTQDRRQWEQQSKACVRYFDSVVRSPEVIEANRRIFSA